MNPPVGVPAEPIASARVVGTGSIGSRYLRVLRGLVGGPLLAVSVRGSLSAESSGLGITPESIDLGDRPSVELTVIATRTSRHVDDALAYLGSTGCLLVEKPVASTASDAQALASVAGGRPVAVATPLRFMTGFSAVRSALPALGPIESASARCLSWLPDWRPGTDYRQAYSADPDEGGVLRDLVHEIDYALSLFGRPESLSARLARSPDLGIAAESTAAMTWTYPSFPLAVDLDFASRHAERVLDVLGRDGRLTWDLLAGTVTVSDRGGAVTAVERFPDDLDRDVVLARQVLAVRDVGHDDRVSDIADAITAVTVCDLARESDTAGGSPVPMSTKGAGT